MKKPLIGILAGMGPRSTAPFIDLVVTECQSQCGAKDDIDFPKMLICSQPAPFYADQPVDHAAMQTAICAGLSDLEQAGADFIGIACNTAHIYYPALAARLRVPLLNMVELTLEKIPPSARKVAVIAARPTIESGIYQEGLQQGGYEMSAPDWQADVDLLIESTRHIADSARCKAAWRSLLAAAGKENADTVIIACMDLSAIRHHIESEVTIIDAGHCLSHEIVRRWAVMEKGSGS